MIEACLGMLEAGDVGEYPDEVGDLVIAVAHGADGQPLGVQFAVLASVPDFPLPVTIGRQAVPHGGVEGVIVLAGGEQTGALTERFGLAVTGDLGKGAVDCGNALLEVGDQHAFGGAFEHGGGLLQFFLHLLAFGDVAGDGQQAFVAANGQRLRGKFAEAQLAALGAHRGDQVAHAALLANPLHQVFTIFRVGPDAQAEGALFGNLVEAVAGDAAETVVGLHQQAVAQTGDQQAVGRGVEGLGELLFGYLQLLLGALELADVAHHHDQCRGVVEHELTGRDETGEQAAIGAAEEHFQVAQAFVLQAQQQARADAGHAP